MLKREGLCTAGLRNWEAKRIEVGEKRSRTCGKEKRSEMEGRENEREDGMNGENKGLENCPSSVLFPYLLMLLPRILFHAHPFIMFILFYSIPPSCPLSSCSYIQPFHGRCLVWSARWYREEECARGTREGEAVSGTTSGSLPSGEIEEKTISLHLYFCFVIIFLSQLLCRALFFPSIFPISSHFTLKTISTSILNLSFIICPLIPFSIYIFLLFCTIFDSSLFLFLFLYVFLFFFHSLFLLLLFSFCFDFFRDQASFRDRDGRDFDRNRGGDRGGGGDRGERGREPINRRRSEGWTADRGRWCRIDRIDR